MLGIFGLRIDFLGDLSFSSSSGRYVFRDARLDRFFADCFFGGMTASSIVTPVLRAGRVSLTGSVPTSSYTEFITE